MRDELAPAFMNILGEMFPRSIYCLVFQLGDTDKVGEMDLEKTETTNIMPALSVMHMSLEEAGLNLKKHFEEASLEVTEILNRALAKAFIEKMKEMADEKAEEDKEEVSE